MYITSLAWVRETFPMTVWVGIALLLSFLNCGLPAADAQTVENAKQTKPIILIQFEEQQDYFTARTVVVAGAAVLDEYTINGPPTPPAGYKLERSAVAQPRSDQAMGIKTLTVPAFNWVFGCSSVSGAMIAAYFDRNGYPNIYTGPTNGGVMPLDNSCWPTWTDGYTTYPNLPLAASHQGVDGRTTPGSIDDYWVQYDSSSEDPYVINGWTQHTWGDAIGDYMKTSQSAYDNTDGSTTFYSWRYDAGQLTCSDMVANGIHTLDGTYGRKLFYEARGYTVADCYNQKTDNNGGGFSFTQYKAEIDANRPVMLNLSGHTVVGVGYDDSTNTVYIHDTWDYSTHTMTWGGSYSGMQLLSVSIVNLSAVSTTLPTVSTTAVTQITSSSAVSGGNISSSGSSAVIASGVCWSTSSNPTTSDYCTSDGAGTGSFTSTITGLSASTTYHVRAYATNSSGTAYGSDVSFTTADETAPTVTTTAVSSITGSSAVSGGNVTSSGSSSVTARGVCWSTSANPTVSGSHTSDGTGTGSFSSTITGLSPSTTYYVRAYATNSNGTAYGADISFTTGARATSTVMPWLSMLLLE